GTHTGSLWSSTGTRVATGTFTNETASGWQTLQFATPIAVSAGTMYVASYYAPSGHYADDSLFFYYRDYQAPPLSAQSYSPTTTTTYNGVFASGDRFPNTGYQGDNYYVDVTYVPTLAGYPSIVSTTPADGATSVDPSVKPAAVFSSAMNPSTLTFTVDGLNGPVTGSVSYDATSKTATFTPSAALPTGTDFTASVSGQAPNGNNIVGPTSWTFTTSGPPSCPCTLFPPTTVPTTPDSGDTAPVSVGV